MVQYSHSVKVADRNTTARPLPLVLLTNKGGGNGICLVLIKQLRILLGLLTLVISIFSSIDFVGVEVQIPSVISSEWIEDGAALPLEELLS